MDQLLIVFLVIIGIAVLMGPSFSQINIFGPGRGPGRGRGRHQSYPRHYRRRGYRADHHDMPLVIGGEKDRHGCLRSAGYSWDVEEQKCERPWISHLN